MQEKGNENQQSVIIDLDDIQLDKDDFSELVSDIDDDLAYLKEEKENAKGIKKEQINIIEKNYKNQIVENPYNNLNAKQMQCIDLYLQGISKSQICEQLGISRGALNNWFNNQRFLEVMDNVKRDFDESNQLYFRHLVPKALERLAGVLDDEATSNKDLISAVKLVLKGSKLIDDNSENKVTHNQMQIIVNNSAPEADVREIEPEIIDVNANEK